MRLTLRSSAADDPTHITFARKVHRRVLPSGLLDLPPKLQLVKELEEASRRLPAAIREPAGRRHGPKDDPGFSCYVHCVIYLHYGSGAGDFEVVADGLPPAEWARVRGAARRLLEARGDAEAAEALGSLLFRPFEGTNHFNDDFALLLATVSIERYAELEHLPKDPIIRSRYHSVADTLAEVGYPVRFTAIAPDTSDLPDLVPAAALTITSQSVSRALTEAEVLLHQTGAASAVDRVHTAMHAYLREVCRAAGLATDPDAGMTELWKIVREQHPAFASPGHRGEEVARIVKAISTILDSANTLRNRASGAHPSAVLREPEAILAINATRTLLHYLDAKVR